MKYLGIYIKDRKMYFLLTAFICGVTAVINYLYSAPLQAGLYAFEISLTVLVIVCAADYVHFYKKHENLQRHCHLKEVHALEEDAAHTAIERDYQQLVLKLIQEKAQLAEHMQKKQTDMMDYYAIWAHQIKTPIAAVDLLLQVMEENPQEVAEQDIKELKSELFKIDFYVEAVSISLETKYRIVFVLSFSSLMKKFFIDQNPVDLNLFLAFQSPIYAYSISKKEQSKDIFYTWFEPLAASLGCDIFKTDYDLAVSYFKLMNHAFFQFSITNMQEIKQDPFLVEAQKLMKNAIVTLSNKLYSK